MHYIEYVVNERGLEVDSDKVSSIIGLSQPRSPKNVRRGVGMTSWYRPFVPYFSTLVASLTDLVQKRAKWRRTEDCERAFEGVKRALVSASTLEILTSPDRLSYSVTPET